MTFESLYKLLIENNYTLAELKEHTLCGECCGLCNPYLNVMAITGKVCYESNEVEAD